MPASPESRLAELERARRAWEAHRERCGQCRAAHGLRHLPGLDVARRCCGVGGSLYRPFVLACARA